jgi:hypothetical protein
VLFCGLVKAQHNLASLTFKNDMFGRKTVWLFNFCNNYIRSSINEIGYMRFENIVALLRLHFSDIWRRIICRHGHRYGGGKRGTSHSSGRSVTLLFKRPKRKSVSSYSVSPSLLGKEVVAALMFDGEIPTFGRYLLPQSSWRNILLSLSLKHQVPPKRWYIFTKVHGVKCQNK